MVSTSQVKCVYLCAYTCMRLCEVMCVYVCGGGGNFDAEHLYTFICIYNFLRRWGGGSRSGGWTSQVISDYEDRCVRTSIYVQRCS